MILNGMVDLSYLRVAGSGGADPSCLRVTDRGRVAGRPFVPQVDKQWSGWQAL